MSSTGPTFYLIDAGRFPLTRADYISSHMPQHDVRGAPDNDGNSSDDDDGEDQISDQHSLRSENDNRSSTGSLTEPVDWDASSIQDAATTTAPMNADADRQRRQQDAHTDDRWAQFLGLERLDPLDVHREMCPSCNTRYPKRIGFHPNNRPSLMPVEPETIGFKTFDGYTRYLQQYRPVKSDQDGHGSE